MKLTSLAVLSLLAALSFTPPAFATTDFIVDRVNKENAAASEFFFDSGKGLFWQPGAGGTAGSSAAVDAFIKVWQENAAHNNDVSNMDFLGEWGTVGITKGTVSQAGIDEARTNGISTKAVQLLVGSTSGAGKGQLTADGADCWAHASSNVLQYWQSYYGVFASNKDNLLLGYAVKDKQTAVDLLGTQSLKLTKWFYIPSSNKGGDVRSAMTSYLTDKTYSSSANTFGDYFANAYASVGLTSVSASNLTDAVFKHMDCSLVGGQVVQNSYGKLAEFTIGYADGSGVPHALTLYGFGVDDAGKVNRLYYADSDDQAYGIKTYYLKAGENGDSRVYLYSNADYTLSSTEKLKYVYELVSIQTPDNLKEMGKQYWEGDLEWSGKNAAGTVKDTWTAGEGLGSTAETLPTGDTGWRVAVNDGYYDSFFYATRNVRFNDAGIASDADSGTVKISGAVTAPRMTIDNGSKKYIFTSSGSEGDSIALKELVKSGGGVAAIEDLKVSTSLLSVKGGTLALGNSASLIVSGTSDVVRGGTLSMQGGTASLGNATFAAGSVLKASDTGSTLNATSLTFADGTRFSFDLKGAGTVSSLLKIDCSSITFGNNISFDFSNGTTGTTYNLISFDKGVSNDWLKNFVSYNGTLSFSDNTLTLTYAEEKTATWTGGTNTWSSSSLTQWSSAPDGASVTFGSNNAETVTVSGKVNPSSINVTGGSYVFESDSTNPGSISGSRDLTVSGAGTSLTAKLNLGDRAVKVQDSASFVYDVADGSVKLAGLAVDSGASATFQGSGTYDVYNPSVVGTLTVNGTAKLALHSDASVSTAIKLTMTENASVQFRNTSNSGMVSYSLSIGPSAGTINVGSAYDMFGTRLNVTSAETTYTIAKDSILSISGSGTANFKASGEGTVLVDSGKTVSLAVSQSAEADGTLLQGTLSDVNFEVAKTATATLKSSSKNMKFEKTITVNGTLEHIHEISYTYSNPSTVEINNLKLDSGIYKFTGGGQYSTIVNQVDNLEVIGSGTIYANYTSTNGTISAYPQFEMRICKLSGDGNIDFLREKTNYSSDWGHKGIVQIDKLDDFSGSIKLTAGLATTFESIGTIQNLVLGGGNMTGEIEVAFERGSGDWLNKANLVFSGDTTIGGLKSTALGITTKYSANYDKMRLAGGTCSIDDPSTITTPSDGTRYTLTIKTQSSSDDYTYTGHVGAGLNLAKQGEGKQSFVGDLSKFNGDVEVKGGTLVMTSSKADRVSPDNLDNAAILNVERLGITGGAKLQAVLKNTSDSGADSALRIVVSGAFEARAYVSDLVGAAEAATLALDDAVGTNATENPVATINAALDLSNATSLTFETGVDLEGQALTLWSDGTKKALTLSQSMGKLQENGTYNVTLFSGVASLDGAANDKTVKAQELFSNTANLTENSTLVYNSTEKTIVLTSVTFDAPEPTTATLALLGLMGLCARRRRQKSASSN